MQSHLSADTEMDFRRVLQVEGSLPHPLVGKLGSICNSDSTFFLWFSLQLAITPACFPHLINELNKTCIRCLFCIRMRVMIFIFLFHFFFKKLSLNSVLFARLLFFNSLIFLILVVCAHGGKRTTCRRESVLRPPWASWRLNSGSQAWQHVPSPVESSH